MHTVVLTDANVITEFIDDGGAVRAVTHPAVAITDGFVSAVGDDALGMVGAAGTESRSLAGATILPGIGDGHAHPVFAGAETLGPCIRDCTSVDQIAQRVAQFALEHPELDWIVGGSYDSTLTADGLFDARWLDHVDRPVVLNCQDYHTYWVNSAALEAAEIDSSTAEPPLGRIVRRGDGSPLGTLQEYGAIDLMKAAMPARSTEFLVDCIDWATAEYSRLGVTWAQDAWVEPSDVDGYLSAARQNRIHVRVNLALKAEPGSWRAQLDGFTRDKARVDTLAHPRLTCHSIKFFVDGVVENYTADMLEPYSDVTNDDRGIANWSHDELLAAATRVDALGFQLHLHAIGDAAVRRALDVIEQVTALNGERDRRPVIAHVHVLNPVDTPRFAELGVIANFEPYWAQLDDVMVEQTAPRLGPERTQQQYRIADLIASGAAVSMGSDWPVTTADWRPAVQVAVSRQTEEGIPEGGWIPSQRISVESALNAYTSGSAYQSLSDSRGRLVIGSAADFLVLEGNPLTTAPHMLPSIRVQETWIDGQIVWRDEEYDTTQRDLAHTVLD